MISRNKNWSGMLGAMLAECKWEIKKSNIEDIIKAPANDNLCLDGLEQPQLFEANMQHKECFANKYQVWYRAVHDGRVWYRAVECGIGQSMMAGCGIGQSSVV